MCVLPANACYFQQLNQFVVLYELIEWAICTSVVFGCNSTSWWLQSTGVGSGGRGGLQPPWTLDAGGCARPPTNLRQWVSETRCEINLPAVIHSGMAHRVFLRLRRVSAISPTPISPTPILPTYYRSVPFRLLMQNVTKTMWNCWNKLYKLTK